MPQFRPGESRPYQVYTILQDIIRRVKAEQLLRAGEERFRLLIEHGQEILSIVDADANIHYVSPSVERTLGYTPDSLIGTSVLDLIHPDDRPAAQQLLAKIASSPNSTATASYRLRHHDGSWRYIDTAATNALHVRGLQGIICNSRDITDAKDFERELLLSRDQLRRLAAHAENTREQERIRIAREIHDELGQTLSALRLDLERLAMKYAPRNPAAGKEFNHRVEDMIRNIDLTILTVRRIAAELRPGILEHLGLAAALDWQIDQFQSRTGIRCRCRGLKGLARAFPLPVEPSIAVFRIFQEILTNIVRHAKASAVTIDVGVKADWLTLSVADNGCGVDPKHLSDPRALGLLGMRERAILFGGSVDFSPRREGGTVVAVRIPVKSASVAPDLSGTVIPELAPASGRPSSPRILIAEDHAIYRKGLKAVLAETVPAAFCAEVENIEQALEALRVADWDILLLDLSMAGKSGMALLAAMLSPVPVLVISTYEGVTWASRMRRAGAAGYISKSSSLDRISAAVTTILAGQQYFPK